MTDLHSDKLVEGLRREGKKLREAEPGRGGFVTMRPQSAKLLASDLDEAANTIEALQARNAHLEERIVETQMLAFKWMEAHDKLHSGKTYEFPSPANVPDCLARLDRVTGLLSEARLYVEGCFGDLDLKLLSQIDEALNGERM